MMIMLGRVPPESFTWNLKACLTYPPPQVGPWNRTNKNQPIVRRSVDDCYLKKETNQQRVYTWTPEK